MKLIRIFIISIITLGASCIGNNTQETTDHVGTVDSVNRKSEDTIVLQNKTTDTTITELKNSSAKFIWRKTVWDPEIKDSVSQIFINEEYCKRISDPEKAAIAYVATFVGNDCMWDGDAKDDRSNLKCRILTALNMGYQCSDTHLNYLRTWFKNDTFSLEQLADCPTIPYTATVQSTFDYIDVKTKNNIIRVFYTKTDVNMRDGSIRRIEHRIDEFKLVNGALKSGGSTVSTEIFAKKDHATTKERYQ